MIRWDDIPCNATVSDVFALIEREMKDLNQRIDVIENKRSSCVSILRGQYDLERAVVEEAIKVSTGVPDLPELDRVVRNLLTYRGSSQC